MTASKLSEDARKVLEALCENAEGMSIGENKEWRMVYLDNARHSVGMSANVFRSYLAVLSEAGFYKIDDGHTWGIVRDSAFQVCP